MKTEEESNRGKAESMSCFVCTDYTVLAIVEGLLKEGYIDKEDKREMANALRVVNEVQVAGRYAELMKHKAVNRHNTRKFTDVEVYQSCKCWLYQVDNGTPMSLDYITIVSGVKMLADAIEKRNIDGGAWKHAHWFGKQKVLVLNADGEWDEISKTVEWDLAA